MMDAEFEIKKWGSFLRYYWTIQLTILTLAIVQVPTRLETVNVLGYQTVDGWAGLWFVLEILGISFGLILTLSPFWRALPFSNRRDLIFGYWGGAWIGLVSLMLTYAFQTRFAFLIAGLGLAGAVIFYWLRRRSSLSGELFP